MSVVENNILNKWSCYKHNMVKYNEQSSLYNKERQNNYNNSICTTNKETYNDDFKNYNYFKNYLNNDTAKSSTDTKYILNNLN